MNQTLFRSEKKEKLDAILARQSELVQVSSDCMLVTHWFQNLLYFSFIFFSKQQRLNLQKLFAVEVEAKKLRYQIRMENRLSYVTDPELVEYWKQVEEIDNDMSISDREADIRKKEVRFVYTYWYCRPVNTWFQLKYKLTPMQRRYLKRY